jgi:hypothetical protein
MPVTYSCDSCGYDDSDDYAFAYCDCCSDYLCSDCRDDHAGDGETYNGLNVQPIDGATPGAIVTSLRAVGIEWEQDGGSPRGVVDDLGPMLLESKGEHCGFEFVSQPFRGASVERMVSTFSRALAANGFRPTDECGTHFHVDVTGETVAARYRIAAALSAVEEAFYALARGRRTATWCRPTSVQWVKDAHALLVDADEAARLEGTGARVSCPSLTQRDRYCGVNLHAMRAHGTVEVRTLDGYAQTDTVRLLHAVAVATAVADYAATATTDDLRGLVGNAHALLAATALTPDALTYVLDAIAGEDAREVEAARAEQQRARVEAVARAEYDRVTADAHEAYALLVRYAEQSADRTAHEAARATTRRTRESLNAARAAYEAAERAYMTAQRVERDTAYAVRESAADMVRDARLAYDALVNRAGEQYRAARAAVR